LSQARASLTADSPKLCWNGNCHLHVGGKNSTIERPEALLLHDGFEAVAGIPVDERLSRVTLDLRHRNPALNFLPWTVQIDYRTDSLPSRMEIFFLIFFFHTYPHLIRARS
jgi:hypothetical protein